MQLNCIVCGDPFDATKPAKYCSGKCNKRAQRGGVPSVAPVQKLATEVSGLVDAVRQQLEAAEVFNTVGGQHAIEVATRIVNAPGMNAGVASLSKELSRLMSEVLNTSTVVVDPLDEIAARRAAKLAAAAG